jgi:hypothetical protein
MTYGDKQYAAMQFFSVGQPGETVTLGENDKHLREELLRQQIASKAFEKFSTNIRERKVSAYGKCFLQPVDFAVPDPVFSDRSSTCIRFFAQSRPWL